MVEGMNFKKRAVFLILLITLLEIRLTMALSSTGDTKLSLTPEHTYPLVKENFIVNATVTNVTDLSAWQVKLTFNPFIINCIEVTIPDDNVFAGHETTGLSCKIDNNLGLLTAFNGLWELNGVNGSGNLCQIKFNTSCPGFSFLAFTDDTYLQNSEMSNIPFEASSGTVQVVDENFQLYIFAVVQNQTSHNVTIYTSSNITEFDFNQVSRKISFVAANWLNSTSFCTVGIPKALLNGTFAILANDTALWYTMSSDPVYQFLHFILGFENSDIQVITTIVGDLNGDRKVDMRDISIAARAFGTIPEDQRWDPRADVHRDRKVDMKDITIIAKNFGGLWLN